MAMMYLRQSVQRPIRTMSTAIKTNERKSLAALSRDFDGSRWSRKSRESGWIPSVLYGGDFEKQLLKVDVKDLRKMLRETGKSFENQTLDLVVGDNTYLVLPRQLQIHPATERIMNVNFLIFKKGLTIDIPLKTINEDQSPAIRRGAFFLQVSKFLKCKTITENIPPSLEVNLAGAKNKEVVRLDRVVIPESIEAVKVHENFCIGTVVGKRSAGEV